MHVFRTVGEYATCRCIDTRAHVLSHHSFAIIICKNSGKKTIRIRENYHDPSLDVHSYI